MNSILISPFIPNCPGDSYVLVGGQWVLGDINQVKVHARAVLEQAHAEVIERLSGNPTPQEKATWEIKLDAANSVIEKSPVSAAGIAFMQGVGLTTDAAKSAWAAKVLSNAAVYWKVVGVADKLRASFKASIAAASDVVAVQGLISEIRADFQAASVPS